MSMPGVTAYIKDRILIEALDPIFATINPQLYETILMAGGAASIRLVAPTIASPDVDYKDQEIVILTEMMNTLSHEEQLAVIAHETSHIVNGDCKMENPDDSVKIMNNLDHELSADLAAVKAVNATAMLSAINKMQIFQINKLFRIKNPIVAKVLAVAFRTSVARTRIKALKKMIKQGM